MSTEGRRRGTLRRLVLTSEALLERRVSPYEVEERRPLASLAAVVRFSDEPQWLALEWTDGAAPTMYITPSRDSLLSAVLDTAQVWSSSFSPLCVALFLPSCHLRSLWCTPVCGKGRLCCSSMQRDLCGMSLKRKERGHDFRNLKML